MTPLLLLMACSRQALPPEPSVDPVASPEETLPTAYHDEATRAAAERAADPARGGPPVHPSASPLPPFLEVSRATATYVGAATCAGCHPEEHQTWSASAHARARESLVERGKGYDPSCLSCHVTGMMHPGGFAGMKQTPHLEHVGCEACHGPASDHLAAPESPYGALAAGPESCVACHTHDNSPDFRWEAYWPEVTH